MNPHFALVGAELRKLDDAIAAQDAGAIIAASETLAAAVARLYAAPLSAAEARQAPTLLADLLGQMNGSSIKVNMLANWNRQRIDSMAKLRGDGIAHSVSVC